MPSRLLSFGRSHQLESRHDNKARPPLIDHLTEIDNSVGEQRRHPNTMDIRDILKLGPKDKGSSSSGRSSPKIKGSPKAGPAKPAKLEVEMESPPLVFFGTTEDSTGALAAGLLVLTVTEPEVRLTSIHMDFSARTISKHPVSKSCPDCITKTNNLKMWNFITEDTTYCQGIHRMPFSYLIPGHLPATSHTDLADIDYILEVKATTTLSETLTYERSLKIQRSLPVDPEKTSVRLFPPTELKFTLEMPQHIHPIGQFVLKFCMTGVVEKKKDFTQCWQITKMIWRIEEHTEYVSPACPKHWHKVGGEGKGRKSSYSRTTGSDDFSKGWKTEYSADGGGRITVDFPISVRNHLDPVCDVQSSSGLIVTHTLVLEIVVAEYIARRRDVTRLAPTQTARILRTSFKLILTERAGLGISWDEERPPAYNDVPPFSPPGYIEDYHLEDVPELDLEPAEGHHITSDPEEAQ